MGTTFKSVLEDTLMRATGGNRGQTTQAIEAWTQNTYEVNDEENFDTTAIKTAYERQQFTRHVYTIKMRQARKIHASV